MEETERKFGFNQNFNCITGGGTEKAYIENKEQSTTGNVYGIYDIRGGASEYVASYYKDGNFSNANSTFTNGTSDEYSTAYTGDDASSAYKYGDATYETSGWHEDYAGFVDSSDPFFRHGGCYSNFASAAGVFFFSTYDRQQQRRQLIPCWPSSVMCNLLSEQKINFF